MNLTPVQSWELAACSLSVRERMIDAAFDPYPGIKKDRPIAVRTETAIVIAEQITNRFGHTETSILLGILYYRLLDGDLLHWVWAEMLRHANLGLGPYVCISSASHLYRSLT